MTVDESVRAQLAEEIGEDVIIPQDEKFILLQKYGIAKPVIDKRTFKPNGIGGKGSKKWMKQLHRLLQQPTWMTDEEYKERVNNYRMIVNLYRNNQTDRVIRPWQPRQMPHSTRNR